MDENENTSLDTEFKRYLQIMRPYLEQLLDQDVIEICKAWIKRLSNCQVNEKSIRNKYIFALCYQLAKGVLDEPFLKFPSEQELSSLSDDIDSDVSSTEVEYMIINAGEENTRVIYDSKKLLTSDAENHENNEFDNESKSYENNDESANLEMKSPSHKQSLICYTCPSVSKAYEQVNDSFDEYKCRANNVVMKLREIKTQNLLLQKELGKLRHELQMKTIDNDNENITKIETATSGCFHAHESTTVLDSLKTRLQNVQDSRNALIRTVEMMQEKLNNFENIKKHELDEIEASHKMELIKTKTATREETKEIYDKKFEDLKHHYEIKIENIENKLEHEKQEMALAKDRIISEKEQIINAKDNEIARLRNLNDDQKSHLQGMINKFLEKPNEDTVNDSMRYKADQLEKRLNKVEKLKAKCIRMYEAKLAHVQREKHLVECSLQLQLVRQRAQVVNDVADENQTELSTALNKLESKYKEIVGNMQAAAIQRRVQDQMAIQSILHAACGIRNENYTTSQGTNRSQFSAKTMQNQNRNGNQMNQSFDSEISALLARNKVDNLIGCNKSSAEDSVMAGYCLDGERMGELFERVYIPQRDIGDGPLKK